MAILYIYTLLAYDGGEWNSSKVRHSPVIFRSISMMRDTRHCKTSLFATLRREINAGTGGFRKMRWADPRRGKGRRGGLRIIYYDFPRDHQIWLMTLFDKSEAAGLSPKEKKALNAAIEAEVKMRETRRKIGNRRAGRI